MPDSFHVVVTGASKGIGKALVVNYLSRPNTTVIAAVRDLEASTRAFKDILRADKGSLILVRIESSSETDALDAANLLRTRHNLKKVDLVIANAGMGIAYDAAADTPLQSLTEHFRVNAGGPLLLFQAFRPLLLAAAGSDPKFVVLSSAIASLADTGSFPLKSTAYGASKAAANFIAQRIHAEEEWLTAFPISPGWVQTGMGDAAANAVGMSQAPMTVDDSASGIIRVIEAATRAESSGRFVDYRGQHVPW